MEYNGIAHCSIKRCIIIVGCVTIFVSVIINITTANENIDGTIENENIITEGGGGGGGIVIENMERGDEIGNIAVDDSIQEELKDIENAGIRESDVRVESETIVTDEDVNSGTNDVSEEIPPPVIIPEDMQLTQLDPVEVCITRPLSYFHFILLSLRELFHIDNLKFCTIIEPSVELIIQNITFSSYEITATTEATQ